MNYKIVRKMVVFRLCPHVVSRGAAQEKSTAFKLFPVFPEKETFLLAVPSASQIV